MKKVLCVILILALLLPFAGCKDDKDQPENQVIAYNLEAEPKTLDPQIAEDYSARVLIMSLFEGLVRVDENGTAVPGVAESWTANRDYTSYTFYLRKDSAWSKSTEKEPYPVTAADFVFGFQRALDARTGAAAASELFCIKNARAVHSGAVAATDLGVHAADDYTLVIDLEYSYEDFPLLTALPVAMPCNRAFFESTGGQYGLETNAVLGNGPYKISGKYSWTHGKSISLSKNSNYKGEKTPVPAGISFSIGTELSNTVSAISSGTVDAAPLLGEQLAAAKEKNFNLSYFEDTTWGLCFNVQKAPFTNRAVRRGLVTALERSFILTQMPGNYTEATDIVTPGTTFAGKSYRQLAGGGFCLPFDPNAQQTLAGGLTALGEKSMPAVTVLCLNTPEVTRMVTNMLDLWSKNLGCYFSMKPVSSSELTSMLRSGDYQLAFAPVRAESDGPDTFLSVFKSTSSANPAKLADAEYDALLAQAQQLPAEQGLELYAEAEHYLNDNAVFFPLCYENRYFASAQNVTGILFHPYDAGIDFSQAVKIKK